MTTFLPTLHYPLVPELDAEDKSSGFTSSVIVPSGTDFSSLTLLAGASDAEKSLFLSTGGADGQPCDGRSITCTPHPDLPNKQEKNREVDGSRPGEDGPRKQNDEEEDGTKKSPHTRDRFADVGNAVSVDVAPASSSPAPSTGRVLKQKTNLMKAEVDGKGSGSPGGAGSGGESNLGEYGGRPKRGTAGRKSKGNKMSAVVGADGEVQIIIGGGNKQEEAKEVAEVDCVRKTSRVGSRKVSSRKESVDKSSQSGDGEPRRTERKEGEKGETKEEDEREKRRRLRAEKRAAVLLGQRKAIFEVQMVLLEGVATDGQMQLAKKIIIRSEYEDVVAERANIRVCGNPRCGNTLAAESSGRRRGRYRISLREKKVYDTHAVLNYCSAECAVASKTYECSLEKEHGMELGLTELAKLVSAIKSMGSKPLEVPRGDGSAGAGAGADQITTGQGASSELKMTPLVNGENEIDPVCSKDGDGDGASHKKPVLHISERVSSAAQADPLSISSTLVPTGPPNAIEGYVLQNRPYPAAVIAGAAVVAAAQSKRRQGKSRKSNTSSSMNDAAAAPEVHKQRGGSSVRLALKSAEANDEHFDGKVLHRTAGPETAEATTVSPRTRRSLTNKEHRGEGSPSSERRVEAVVGQQESRRKSNRRGVTVSSSATATVCLDGAAEAHHAVDPLPVELRERGRAASSVSSEGKTGDSDTQKATGEVQAAEQSSIPGASESVEKQEVEAIEQTGDDLRTLLKADEATGSAVDSAAPSPPPTLRSALHKEKHRVPRSVSWADHRNAPLEVVDPRDVRDAKGADDCHGDAFVSQWGARRPRGTQPKRYCKLEGKRRGGLRDVIIFDDALGSEMVDLGPSMSRFVQDFPAVSGKREQRSTVSRRRDEKGLAVGTDRGPKGLSSSGARVAKASNKKPIEVVPEWLRPKKPTEENDSDKGGRKGACPVSESSSGHADDTPVKGEAAAGQQRSKRLLEVVPKDGDDRTLSGGSLGGLELSSPLAGEETAILRRGDGNKVDKKVEVPERTGFAETVKGPEAVCVDGGVFTNNDREHTGRPRHVEDSAIRGVKNEVVCVVDGQNEDSKEPDAQLTASHRVEMAESPETCCAVPEHQPTTKPLDSPAVDAATVRLNCGDEEAIAMSDARTGGMCVPSDVNRGKFRKAHPIALYGEMCESSSPQWSNVDTKTDEDATEVTRCAKLEELTDVAPAKSGEETVTRSKDSPRSMGSISHLLGSSGSREDTSKTCGARRSSTEGERRSKGKEAVAEGSREVDGAESRLQGETSDDPRLTSAKAIAEALAHAAAAVESGDVEPREAATLAGLSIMVPETSAGSDPSLMPCFSGRGEREERLRDDEEEKGEEEDEESLERTTDSQYSTETLRKGRRIDQWQKSEWYSPPPKGFQAQVSQFGTMWMSLEEWVSASTVVYLYREDVGTTGDEGLVASDDLVVSGRHYPKQIVLGDGTSAEISRAFAECISRALPLVQQSLRISVPLTSIEQAMGRLIKSFSLVSPLPSFGMAQWRAVSILFVEALSIHRLPRVHEQLSRQRDVLKKAIEKTGTLETEYKAFWDLIMPWGDRKPKLNGMTA